MAELIIISGLKSKQEEIRKRIADLEKQLQAARKDFLTISDALRVFGEPQSYAKTERPSDVVSELGSSSTPYGLPLKAWTRKRSRPFL
jgi:hypothetical protein